MVSIKTFLASSVALIVAFANVEAAVSPTYPSPGTIQIEGQSYDITWTFDGKDPKTTYTIDFMTGSNDVQTKLQTVATVNSNAHPISIQKLIIDLQYRKFLLAN
ncbi:hypothetical protein G6F42_023877 [Rhizopus arrhizus]|nr:hypothetical protein G6F42_023877 [Rhizopus arrhizus]